MFRPGDGKHDIHQRLGENARNEPYCEQDQKRRDGFPQVHPFSPSESVPAAVHLAGHQNEPVPSRGSRYRRQTQERARVCTQLVIPAGIDL